MGFLDKLLGRNKADSSATQTAAPPTPAADPTPAPAADPPSAPAAGEGEHDHDHGDHDHEH